MKYKEGDRVRIKSLDWYNENKNRIDEVGCGNAYFVPDMSEHCDRIVTISSILPTLKFYRIKEDGGMYHWTDEMIEGLVKEKTKPTLDEIMKLLLQGELNIPEGYIFKDENGNVINAQKIVLEKKEKEYPKTYEECCEILNIIDNRPQWHGYRSVQLKIFQKLLICRDAYWKIAGEKMRLGKPWEPDWSDNCQKKWTINFYQNEINLTNGPNVHFVLAFPTEEMRDAFYENFKELIANCKELL